MYADTLRTHITGILSSHPKWASALANYQVEAAWTLGDWPTVATIVASPVSSPEICVGRVLLAMQKRRTEDLPEILADARMEIGAVVSANSRQFARAYPTILQLHMLTEMEMIYRAGLTMTSYHGDNKAVKIQAQHKTLTASLRDRMAATLPSFKVRESVQSIRRAAFGIRRVRLASILAVDSILKALTCVFTVPLRTLLLGRRLACRGLLVPKLPEKPDTSRPLTVRHCRRRTRVHLLLSYNRPSCYVLRANWERR